MNLQLKRQQMQWIAALVIIAVVFVLGCSKKPDNTAAETPQKTFATPAEASQALHTAVKTKDDKALTQVLGAKAQKLVSSGDPTEDKSAADSFARKYDQMNRLVAMTDGSQVLYVGADNYPFPVPLAQDGSSRWYFDAAAGDEELRARRIGSNELSALDACRLLANAEELYHQSTHQYTNTIVSTPGEQDGLYWEAGEGQTPSPLGRLNQFAKTIFNASAPSREVVSHGYSFRIMTTQGGFTIFGSPVDYHNSGIMTFSLGRDGVIYQQDLGPHAADALTAMEQYNPTDGWTQAE
ncbi:MAG TPA: DUF2950 family protein [Acidobacteriaceae bacterium]|nr:DUF2950 family protein [Acidobacteriaceae bacterium]